MKMKCPAVTAPPRPAAARVPACPSRPCSRLQIVHSRTSSAPGRTRRRRSTNGAAGSCSPGGSELSGTKPSGRAARRRLRAAPARRAAGVATSAIQSRRIIVSPRLRDTVDRARRAAPRAVCAPRAAARMNSRIVTVQNQTTYHISGEVSPSVVIDARLRVDRPPPVDRLVDERRGRAAEDAHRRRQLLRPGPAVLPDQQVAEEDQLEQERHGQPRVPLPPDAPRLAAPERPADQPEQPEDDGNFGGRGGDPVGARHCP